eukprot:608430-Pelagomonas_calceolata.AAC.5
MAAPHLSQRQQQLQALIGFQPAHQAVHPQKAQHQVAAQRPHVPGSGCVQRLRLQKRQAARAGVLAGVCG